MIIERDKENITINGYGAILSMRKEDYRTAPYEKAEWRSCLGIYGGSNIKILGITLANCGGDGIYIAGGSSLFSKDITIKDVVAENNYRQGISVISVEGLLIESSILRGTEGTKPAAGIDFEPNGPTDRLVGIVMKDCVIEGNQGYGIQVALGHVPADFRPVKISIVGGRVTDNKKGALIVHAHDVKGELVFQATKLVGKRSLVHSDAFTVTIDPGLK